MCPRTDFSLLTVDTRRDLDTHTHTQTVICTALPKLYWAWRAEHDSLKVHSTAGSVIRQQRKMVFKHFVMIKLAAEDSADREKKAALLKVCCIEI